MAKPESLLIRPRDDKAILVDWGIYDPVSHSYSDTGSDSLESIAALAVGKEVIVILPGTEVTLTHVKLPQKRRSQALKSVGYLVEEQLLGDLDTQHFALGNLDENGLLTVAVTDKDSLRGWVDTFTSQNIYPDIITAEPLMLSPSPELLNLLVSDERIIYRHDHKLTGSFDRQENSELIKHLLHEPGLKSLHLTFCQPLHPDDLDDLISTKDLSIDKTEVTNPVLAFNPKTPGIINLLQGSFGSIQRSRTDKWGSTILVAAVLIWGMLEIGGEWIKNVRLNNSLEDSNSKIQILYQELFPGSRAVKPRLQATQKLEELKRGSINVQSHQGLRLLASLANSITPGDKITIQRISYRNNQMEVELVAVNIPKIDSLIRKLQGLGMDAKLRQANRRDHQVQGNISVKLIQG